MKKRPGLANFLKNSFTSRKSSLELTLLLASASQNGTQLLMQTENYFNQSDKKDVIEIAIRCLQINLYDASINFHPHLCLCQKSLNKKNQSISRIFL